MNVLVASVQVPFVRGGAEDLADTLVEELRARGHTAELLTMPFRFAPPAEVRRAMRIWSEENLERLDAGRADLVICVRFPTYYLSHPNKITWLVHQHRAVYDLWATPWDGGLSQDPDGIALRREIHQADGVALKSCRALFTISHRVSERMREYSGIESTVLHPPSRLAPRLHEGGSEPFVFFPSRLEALKRQSLLVEAMAHVRSPVVALLAGEGGRRPALEEQIARLGLQHRVRLLGRIDDEAMAAYYAHCRLVFFPPFDEDYGLVVLEAMGSAKPVVTCRDSGEPTRIVVDGETGLVVDPEPEAVAAAIDALAGDPVRARRMGEAGRRRLEALGVGWDRIVDTLLDAGSRGLR